MAKNVAEEKKEAVKPAENEENTAVTQGEEEIDEELEKKLAFPTATVVREMKKHIDGSKMIRKEVKIGMNKFLSEVVKEVSSRIDKYPYAMIDYRMLEDAMQPYKKVKELQNEKERLMAHLDVIIQDCLSIKRDLEAKLGETEQK